MSDKYAQPERRPAVVTGASLRHRCRDRAQPGRGRLSRSRSAPGVPTSSRRSRRRSAPTAARRSPTRSTSPTRTRSRRSRKAARPTSATSRSWSATPARSPPATIVEVDSERFTRELDLDRGRRAPAGPGVRAGHERAPARRHRVRLLRHGRPRAAVHGRLLLEQVGPRGHGPVAPDGARGHRRPRQRRPARPDLERDGLRLGRRRGRRSCSTSGSGSAWPGTRTS